MRAICNARGTSSALLGAPLIAAAAAVQRARRAKADYPNRPVTLIVPYARGRRRRCRHAHPRRQAVEPAEPAIRHRKPPRRRRHCRRQAGADAAPDGYTLLMTGNNNAIAAALFKSLPYNILTDFASVSTAAFFDLLIVTRAGSPLHSVQDVDRGGAGQSRQAQYRHHQSGQHAEPRRRAVRQHDRHQGGDRSVPRLARHGRRA